MWRHQRGDQPEPTTAGTAGPGGPAASWGRRGGSADDWTRAGPSWTGRTCAGLPPLVRGSPRPGAFTPSPCASGNVFLQAAQGGRSIPGFCWLVAKQESRFARGGDVKQQAPSACCSEIAGPPPPSLAGKPLGRASCSNQPLMPPLGARYLADLVAGSTCATGHSHNYWRSASYSRSRGRAGLLEPQLQQTTRRLCG